MDEDGCAHYALKIAVTILRERCQHFQRRIAILEEENINLKSLCQKNEGREDSSSQIDLLKGQISSIEEQNSQLQSKMRIIAQENQQLWANLGKLTSANKSLGSHLHKINDSLSQHVIHQPLVRSKTFTQNKPQTGNFEENLKENDKMRLDLEDISLKLLNSMNDIKKEMDSLVQNMNDVENLDNVITCSLGFNYDDENEDIIEDLKIILEELNYVKTESEKQNIMLKENLKNIKIMKENSKCSKCNNNHEEDVKSSSPITNAIQPDRKLTTNVSNYRTYKIGKVCPVCSQQFCEDVRFSSYVAHVESHFKSEVVN